jgi:hypothetical protein
MKRDTRQKGAIIDLGLAIAGATLPPGQTRDTAELARYCGCTKQLIHTIEKRALAKVRATLAERGITTTASMLKTEN